MGAVKEQKNQIRSTATAAKGKDSAAQFVAKFRSHYKTCVTLTERFTADDPKLKDFAAITQLCRASQEMLEQAKEARTLTEIYLALDETHRDTVRPIITARFKQIAKSARTVWLRFCDSVQLVHTNKAEIEVTRQSFKPHAEHFQNALEP